MPPATEAAQQQASLAAGLLVRAGYLTRGCGRRLREAAYAGPDRTGGAVLLHLVLR